MKKHNEIKKRDEIIYNIWEQNKSDVSMEFLSKYVLKPPAPTLYRVIKKQKNDSARNEN